MSYGFADTTAAILSGFILRGTKDQTAFYAFYAISITAMLVFYFVADGRSDSLISYISYYFIVLGCSFNYCITFLMIEHRTPIEHLGSSLVVVFTIGMIASGLAPYIVYHA